MNLNAYIEPFTGPAIPEKDDYAPDRPPGDFMDNNVYCYRMGPDGEPVFRAVILGPGWDQQPRQTGFGGDNQPTVKTNSKGRGEASAR